MRNRFARLLLQTTIKRLEPIGAIVSGCRRYTFPAVGRDTLLGVERFAVV